MGPLSGLKVIEIAGIGPAPTAGMMLADMGAEVLLVERKKINENGSGIAESGDKQAIFNRGKKSLALDLKQQSAKDIVLKLIAESDILIEGFRPGVMEGLGLGPEVCLLVNPKLIYGRMTGWGQSGPLSDSAGHDPNFISLSGALWYGGAAQRVPTSPLTLVGDIGGGTMILLLGILSAVINVQKTGEGQVIDAAITDGSAYISSLLWMMHNTGQVQDELGQGWVDWASPWNNTYECSDQTYITICALEPKFYLEFVELLGLQENPNFKNQWNKKSWVSAKIDLEILFLSQTRNYWCDLLEGTDACFAPVLNLTEAPHHPHNIARETFLTIDDVTQPSPAPKFSVTKPVVGIPPSVGEHNNEILIGLGLTTEDIVNLEKVGVI